MNSLAASFKRSGGIAAWLRAFHRLDAALRRASVDHYTARRPGRRPGPGGCSAPRGAAWQSLTPRARLLRRPRSLALSSAAAYVCLGAEFREADRQGAEPVAAGRGVHDKGPA